MSEIIHACQCKERGFCPVFNRQMTAFDHQICSGADCSKRQKHLAYWMENIDSVPVAQPARGIGDIAASVIKKVTGKKACLPCQKRAGTMNQAVPMFSYPPLATSPIDIENSVRHLVYCIFPIGGAYEWVWRRNLDYLAKYRDIFNGRCLFRIYTGEHKGVPTTDKMVVLSAIHAAGYRNSIINVVKNNAQRREVVGFADALGQLQTQNENEFVFVGHAKGVTHAHKDSTVHPWTDMMYESVMIDWQRAIGCLDRYAIAGSFKRYGTFNTLRNHRWHYSGTFYWMRSATVYRRNWSYVDNRFFGMESWPGSHFKPKEAACLFFDNVGDMYDHNQSRIALKAFDEWRANKPDIPNPDDYESQLRDLRLNTVWTR